MDSISTTELKYIRSKNGNIYINMNKINNLKKMHSYKTRLSKLPANNAKENLKQNKTSFSSKNNRAKTQISSDNFFIKHQSFNTRYTLQKIPLKFSLYSILAMKKNNIYDKIENFIQTESNKIYKDNNINIFNKKQYIKPRIEINKKDIKMIRNNKNSMTYLSFLNKNFNESEKIRFYSMLKKLSSIKYLLELEQNSNNKNKIIKSFLLKEGILNKKYLTEKCINNFMNFIESKKMVVNPSYTFKENLINILKNSKNDSNILKNIENTKIDESYKDYLQNKQMKNIMNLNETIYRHKNVHYHTLDNFKINRFDLDLKNNLNRQTDILRRVEKQKIFDIKKEPEKIMDSVGIDLNKEKNNVINQIPLYKNKKDLNIDIISDLDIFKQKNLVTEYACFLKAKDNFDLNQIKTKYNL
jgi:hypothetical protein